MYVVIPVKTPQSPITNSMLNTADPTMVPVPTSPFAMKTPATETNSVRKRDCETSTRYRKCKERKRKSKTRKHEVHEIEGRITSTKNKVNGSIDFFSLSSQCPWLLLLLTKSRAE